MYFYEKALNELTNEEWEKICMKCGKCCLCKYREEDVIHLSNYICEFFDLKNCLCSCYKKRFDVAKGECKKVDMELLEKEISLLPPSCAYRCLFEGRPLPSYHPLITGDPNSAFKAGATVKSMPICFETDQERALLQLLERLRRGTFDEENLKQEVKKIHELYDLRWLETYPITEPAL